MHGENSVEFPNNFLPAVCIAKFHSRSAIAKWGIHRFNPVHYK